MITLEFWVATAITPDGDLHWSEVMFEDGGEARDMLRRANDMASVYGLPDDAEVTVHGPYQTTSPLTGSTL